VGRQEEAMLELSLGRNAVDYPMEDDWSRDSSTHMKLLQDQLELARQMMDQGTPQQAVQLLSAASIHHPENPMLLNQLAAAYNRSQRPDKALLLVDHILTREPGHVPALVTRAFTLQMLDRNDDALAAADLVIKTAPQIAEGHLARANALLALERDAESLAALEQASRLDPSNAEILLEIGDVLWRNLSRPQDARRRYEQARDANPAFIPAQVRLAEVHLALQNRTEAERAVNTLRRLAPTSPDLPILEQRLRTASSSPAPP
jgi:tetratricopeptide (TPR) repeat protein